MTEVTTKVEPISRQELYEKALDFKEEVESLKLQLTEKDKQIEELTNQNKELEKRCNELFFQVNEQVEQIEKMKSDIKQLCENRMNDDTDQNIIDRLWKEWDVLLGVSN